MVQRSLPRTRFGTLCIQELLERSWRRPISTMPPLRWRASAASQPVDVGDDRLRRQLDLAARGAQHLGDARLERPEVDAVRRRLELARA